VRWTADRSECFFTDGQSRDHVSTAKLALDADGRFLGLEVSSVANMGAYPIHYGPFIPTELCSEMLAGAYRMPAIHAEVKCVFTNMVPIDIYRGTGRAEAIYLLERLVDAAARELDMTPAALRRLNFIAPDALPHTTVTGLTYDSGDFPAILERALGLAGWDDASHRKDAARDAGKLLGIGLAYHVATVAGGDSEHARLRLDDDGGVTVFVGTQSTGQGHETAYAQIVAERLGVPVASVRVRQGDSDLEPVGGGTSGSRSILMGGLAVRAAADALIEQARGVAAYLMQADASDLEFESARFAVTGTDRRIALAEIARAVADDPGELPLPEGSIGAIETVARGTDATTTFANGCHVCELTVDPETGRVEIQNYVAVDDFGTVVNPLLCHGQVHGATAQGIGQALLERIVHDADSGQLLTGTLLDYCMPRADDLPSFDVTLVEDTPCTTNEMGVKGAGESGAIGAPPAVMNALLDALAPLGVDHVDREPIRQEKARYQGKS